MSVKAWVLILLAAVTACTPIAAPTAMDAVVPPTSKAAQSTPLSEETSEGVRLNRRVEDSKEYRFPQMLPFNGIMPVYEPEFAPAENAPLVDEELVIGIALEGEAKAYPISVLRIREMVNDELAGTPILTTW